MSLKLIKGVVTTTVVPLAISYHLDFLRISKVLNMFTSRVGGASSD